MSSNYIDTNYESQMVECDIVMSVCDECGKHTPPNECELCLSEAYKQCPLIVKAFKEYEAKHRW